MQLGIRVLEQVLQAIVGLVLLAIVGLVLLHMVRGPNRMGLELVVKTHSFGYRMVQLVYR